MNTQINLLSDEALDAVTGGTIIESVVAVVKAVAVAIGSGNAGESGKAGQSDPLAQTFQQILTQG
jgi:hypothetical protein